MEPEPGDKSIEVSAQDVASALAATGLQPAATVLFHSSLSSMGTVIGGAEAVIDGFLAAVGPQGTVAAPTLCQRDKERRFETWDIHRSPSDVGRITEVFRLRAEAVRSDHPTHSVAAIGARAGELVQGHALAHGRPGPWGDAAFAVGSPWDKLYRWNASIAFIGVDFTVNTMMHYVQCLVVERVISGLPAEERKEALAAVQGWRKPGVWPYYKDALMEPLRREAGLVRYGKIGSATLRLVEAGRMVDHALAVLEREPQAWFDRNFLGWCGSVLGERWHEMD